MSVRTDSEGETDLPGPPSGSGSTSLLTRRQLLVAGSTTLLGQVLPTVRKAAAPSELVTRCRFGAYAHNEPFPVDPHFELEQSLGSKLPICSWFVAFGQSWPVVEASKLVARGGYDIQLAWELHGILFEDLLAGRHDQYIWEFVNAAALYPGEVILRPFHESNGHRYDWSPTSGRGYCTGVDQWKQAWRHVVSVARRSGKPNVKVTGQV